MNGKILEAVVSNFGLMYGHESVEYEDGWNASHQSLVENYFNLNQYITEHKKRVLIEELLKEGGISFGFYGSLIEPYINCNDLFMYACADDETILERDWSLIEDLWNLYRYDGLYAYASMRRNWVDVVDESMTTDFIEARSYLQSKMNDV